MISQANIPPYNRFDKVPCHALQCGDPPSDNDLTNLVAGAGEVFKNVTEHGNGRKVHSQILGSTGSGQSSESIESVHSQDSCNTGPKTSSDNSMAFEQWTYKNFHKETPVNSHHATNRNVNESEGPPRRNLPKKSDAAKQSVAELLNKTVASFEAFGLCYACNGEIAKASEACEAMGEIYHSKCFTCCSCGRALRGKPFYSVHGRIYCEEDYMYSGFQQNSDKCYNCGHLVMDLVLQAMGKSFHPGCFRCTECNECLDGIQFTVDINNKVYCVPDFHKLFAPKCASCKQPIVPINDSEETVRVVALDRDYHVDCYHCERCKTQLTDEPDKRCYPIGDRLFCYDCHILVRNSSFPSPGASSTSSSHSTNSSASYRSSASDVPRLNGHVRRKGPSKAFAKPPRLLQTTIQEELPDWAKPTKLSSPKYACDNQQVLKQHSSAAHLPPNTEAISDPNLRLQQKIKKHVIANEDFKQRLNQKVEGDSTSAEIPAAPPLNKQQKPQIATQQEVAPPFTPAATFSPESNRSSQVKADKVQPSKVLDCPRATDGHNQQHALPSATEGYSNHPVGNMPTHFAQSPKEHSEHHALAVPRSVPIDLAIPLSNTKRVHSPRRRVPLSDVIMHQKIAESLRKSLESGARYPSPEKPHAQATATHLPRSKSPSPNQSLTRLCNSRTPSPPHYMKVWHASEIARSSPNSTPLAIPQQPVLSQTLPPRLSPSEGDHPPARPPKLYSLQVTKI